MTQFSDSVDALLATNATLVALLQGLQATLQSAIDAGQGPQGWSPVFTLQADGERWVFQVTDWVDGGAGTTKPEVGQYVGSSGYVATAAEAVDVRGAEGASAFEGWIAEGNTGTFQDFLDVITNDAVSATAANVAAAQTAEGNAVTAQGAAEAARDTTIALENQTAQHAADVASAIVYQDLAAIDATITGDKVASYVDRSPRPPLSVQMVTSWYNETLGTSTRGTRREMPSVPVIDAEGNTVTMRDGDDPSLPMWMVFNEGSGSFLLGQAGTISCVHMSGQFLFIGSSTATGLVIVDFAAGIAYGRRADTNRYNAVSISDRNSGVGVTTIGYFSEGLANNTVNAIATYIAPNAPRDEVSGLAIPVVPVGTAGGLSVILEDGTVHDSALTSSVTYVIANEFGVWYGSAGNAYYATWADIRAGDGFGDLQATRNVLSGSNFLLMSSASSVVQGDDALIFSGSDVAVDAVPGLMRHFPNYRDQSKGLFQLQTTDYATPLMFGDVKGAWLSEASDADLVGATPLDDDFSSYANDAAIQAVWPTNGLFAGTATLGTSSLILTTTPAFGRVTRAFTTVVGERYRCSALARRNSGTGGIYISVSTGDADTFSSLGTQSASFVEVSLEFTATETSYNLHLTGQGASSEGEFDDVKIEKVTPDRSVNDKGLIINGTVSAAYVNTGATTVGYSRVLASDYLSLDFEGDLGGNDNFTMSFWAYGSTTSLPGFWDWYETPGGGTSAAFLDTFLDTTSQNLRLIWQGRQTLVASGEGESIRGRWSSFNIHFDGAGGGSFYQDGKLVKRLSSVPALDLHEFRVAPSDGNALSLLTISAGEPSAEQIALKYRMERPRFYGGAVDPTLNELPTDISFDPTTGILWAIGASNVIGYDKYGNQVASTLATKPTNHDSIEANNGHVITWEAS